MDVDISRRSSNRNSLYKNPAKCRPYSACRYIEYFIYLLNIEIVLFPVSVNK